MSGVDSPEKKAVLLNKADFMALAMLSPTWVPAYTSLP